MTICQEQCNLQKYNFSCFKYFKIVENVLVLDWIVNIKMILHSFVV